MEVLPALIVFFLVGFFLVKKRRESDENKRRGPEENPGEAAVREMLVELCKDSTAHILNNVTLRFGDGTTQIDHILVTANGILVIETKHFRGWIFANKSSHEWMQVIYRSKHKFQNPLHQNAKHVRAVQELLDFLPKGHVHGLVVFSGAAEFKTVIPEGVIKLSQLEAYAKEFRFGELSRHLIQFCVGRIECERLELTGVTDVEHQAFLQRKFGVVNKWYTELPTDRSGRVEPVLPSELRYGGHESP